MSQEQNISLVTGAAGFMGSHLVDELLRRDHKVIALDDLSGGFRDNVNSQAMFVEGSILDRALIDELFKQHRFTYVFHLAAYAAEGLSHFIKKFNYENNLIGSVNLINASVNAGTVECFMFASSIAVYGSNQLPMTEDAIPLPEDPYGIAKYAVELDLKEAFRVFGLNHVILRLHNVYGERQNIGDRYRNVIGIFMNRIMQGKPMPVFGDGEQTRAFSCIGDVIPCIAEAALTPSCRNDVYNVGSDKRYSVNELAGMVADAFGIHPEIEHLPARSEVLHAYADHTKFVQRFQIQAVTELADGIRKMAKWAQSVGPRKSRDFYNIEVTKNLPEVWRNG
jgi:UDP-glucose 4-epimerase